MRKNYIHFSLAIFLSLVLFNTTIQAQNELTELKPTRISIFKNGNYFITREGEARPKKGLFAITPPSNVLNGTFWLAAGKENKITSISVKPDTTRVIRQIQSTAEFVSGSIGKNITIILPGFSPNSAPREIKGKVLDYFPLTQMIKIRSADGRVLMTNIATAIEVYNDGSDASTYEQDSLVRMAKVQLEKDADRINVSTIAMQKGMSWVPSYYLKLVDEKNAKLELKATISNNTDEQISNAAVDVVIGNPQMFYGDRLDDIAADYFLNQVLNYPSFGQNAYQLSNNYSNYMNGPVSLTESLKPGAAWTRPQQPIENPVYNTDGEKTNDLYYFNLGNLKIESYSKTIVPLLTTDVTYKDLYELEVDDYSSYWNTRSIRNDPNRVLDTWHVLKIENTGKAPFTTGPIFVVDQKEKPLAQDEMKYTAKGANVKVQLSKAIDIQGKNSEEIVRTETSSRKIDDHSYTVVIIKGKLTVFNYQSKSIKISIAKNLTGKVTDAGGGAAESITQYFEDNRNFASTIKWEKEIPANDKITLSYQYEVLLW